MDSKQPHFDDVSTRLRRMSSAQRELLSQSLDARMDRQVDPKTSSLQLVAYVTGNHSSDSELRRHMDAHLPKHMTPSIFVRLDEMPRRSNGKVDRRSLSERPRDFAIDRQQPFAVIQPPRNETEETLAAIWSEVLAKQELGVHDNFFSVGGDSLLSIRVLAMARQQGLQISPEHFFEYPTIAGQASLAQPVAPSTSDDPVRTKEQDAGSSTAEHHSLVELDESELDKIASIFEDNEGPPR